MYNTYDVHFNASWAMIKLWPKLQLALNYDFADMTIGEDVTLITSINTKKPGMRNKCLFVPHDCGDPEDEPWVNINSYNLYLTDQWKDLNPKFVLTVWRDWKLTEDNDYMYYMLPITIVSPSSCV